MGKAKDGAELLNAYLTKRGLHREQFAVRVKSSGASVSRWVHRRRIPGIAVALEIQRATRGAVPVEAWARVELNRAA